MERQHSMVMPPPPEPSSCADQVRELLQRAETIDQNNVSELPTIAAEIRQLAELHSDIQGLAEGTLLQARYHGMVDEYFEAIRLALEALERFSSVGAGDGQVKALSTLGFAYGQLGHLDAALGYLQDGLRLIGDAEAQTPDQQAIHSNLLNNLATIYGDLGRYEEALEVLQEVLSEVEPIGGAPLVVVLSNIAEANLKMGNIVNALVYNQRALAEIRSRNLGHEYLYTNHHNTGKIHELSGQLDKALASYREALADADGMNNRYSKANALVSIASLLIKQGNKAEAKATLLKALPIAEGIGANEILRSIHSLLNELYEQEGDIRNAYLHLKCLFAIQAALETREMERKLANYSAELRIQQIRMDAKITRLKNVELKRKMDEIEQKAAELEEYNRNIKVISRIGQRITNTQDTMTVLITIHESLNELMEANIFAVGFYDEAMGIIEYKIIMENNRPLPLFQVSSDDPRSIASAVIKTGRELMLGESGEQSTENSTMRHASTGCTNPRSSICCPLLLADRIIGVMLVQSCQPDAYSDRNLETVKALASYLAIALHNSMQSEELKSKAYELELASRTDPLTGLYNRRHVMEKIEEECIRFQRSSRPFGVVICDIDFFKKVNDVYGHDCGDAVLKSLATLLGRHIRKQDCLARWGGEEFLLLLPETNVTGAAILAEKLRKRVQEYEFTYAGLTLPITMTFGVAEYIQSYGVDACIVGADSALYKGKSDGRNCVVAF